MTSRRVYAVALLIVVGVGLASRRYAGLFPAVFGKYPGDALWALAVCCGLGILFPRWSATRLAVCGLLVSYADELSQIYQADWINQIRVTTAGHLLLGSTFSWLDMLAYTVGVSVWAVCKTLADRFSNSHE